MDGGLSAPARGIFHSMALMIFMVTSAYLLLELVIALSAQGEPTGAVAPFSGAVVVYPNWYQAPEFLDAGWVALVAYPVAAVVYGIGMLAGWALPAGVPEQARLTVQIPAPPDPAVTRPEAAVVPATTTDDLCVIAADRRIRHITLPTARLFGLTPTDMMGQSLEFFLSPIDLPKLDALVAAAYADPPRAFATTVGILLPEAVVAPVEITCRTGGDEDSLGSNGTTVLTIRPFSERGRLDDQLAALWY